MAARSYRVIRVPAMRRGMGAVYLDPSTKQTIGSTIQQVEGYYPGSIAYRNNNPGNLKYVGQAGATGADSRGFAVFPTYDAGLDALYHQLDLYAGRGLTIQQTMDIYAPASDGNQPAAYAQTIARALGTSVNTRLSDLSSSPLPDYAAPDASAVASFDPLAAIAGVDPVVLAVVAGLAVLTLVTVL